MKTIILTGGGTAGHIMPNIALLPHLKKEFERIVYIGADKSMEQRIAKQHGIEFFATGSVKFSRSNFFANFKIPFVLSACVKQAKSLLNELKPSIVFSKGGYVSLPATLACHSLNIPYIIHESDASLGLANRLVSKNAAKILTAFPSSIKNSLAVGNPLREELFEGNAKQILMQFKDITKPILLVLGGSTGAKAINECIYSCLKALTQRFNVVHIAGKTIDNDIKTEGYFQTAFVNNIQDYIAAADLVVSRCGAIASAELLAAGKKVLFIPLPKTASRGDQIKNALLYEQKNYCLVLPQEQLTPFTLQRELYRLQKANFNSFPYDRQTPQLISQIIASVANFDKN